MNAKNEIDFGCIVLQHREIKKQCPEEHLDFCKQQKSLIDAIDVAARSVNCGNKIHSHQRRIGRQKLNEFAELLKRHEEDILHAKSFDELLAIVSRVKLEKVGDLSYYDIADRIGAYLGYRPEKIYLHAGTREGARRLLGSTLNGKSTISVNELPEELRQYGLTASQLEDLLCTFKDHFIKDQQNMPHPCSKKVSRRGGGC